MMTAKHVLDDVRDAGNVVGSIGVFHIMGKKYFLRNIRYAYEYPNSDVSVVALDQPRHKITNELLKNKTVTLSFSSCKKGEKICTFAYPQSVVKSDGKKHFMEFSPAFFRGSLIEEYPNGRDSSMLPNPCWRTNMHIHGGSSGGPVFNSKGHVIGVNSTSFFGDSSCSFISTIQHIVNLKITDISIAGQKPQAYTLSELVKMGVISAAAE